MSRHRLFGAMTTAPLILLAAGGTGGHLFPAEALGVELIRRGWRLRLAPDSRALRHTGAVPARERGRLLAGVPGLHRREALHRHGGVVQSDAAIETRGRGRLRRISD